MAEKLSIFIHSVSYIYSSKKNDKKIEIITISLLPEINNFLNCALLTREIYYYIQQLLHITWLVKILFNIFVLQLYA